MSNEEYRAWMIEHEYEISRQVNYIARQCPRVTWDEAQKLWQLAVEKTKIFLKVEHICDATFGRGLMMVKDTFVESMRHLEQWRLEREQETFRNLNEDEEAEENWNDL